YGNETEPFVTKPSRTSSSEKEILSPTQPIRYQLIFKHQTFPDLTSGHQRVDMSTLLRCCLKSRTKLRKATGKNAVTMIQDAGPDILFRTNTGISRKLTLWHAQPIEGCFWQFPVGERRYDPITDVLIASGNM
ncbi:hypothetical protein BaRGS_00015653, partial [Batillaria attramentaria]